jgi:hypothetical protein
LVATAFAAADASAQNAKACAEAASSGQVLRDEGKLIQARAKFVTCAQPGCPALIQKDCADWQAAVDARLPTIVIAAKDETGADISSVTVTMDGQPFTVDPGGRSTPVNPGSHKFRAESPGFEPAEPDAMMIREGDRARTVTLTLKHPKSKDVVVVEPPKEDGKAGAGPLPWILAGVGVVGLGLGTFFYLSARSEYSDLEGTCKPHCASDQVDPIRTKQTVGFVSLGIGAAAAIGSVVLFATSSGAVSVKASPTQGGAQASFKTIF